VVGVFKETASGASANRAARNQILDLAQARQIDGKRQLGPTGFSA